MIFSNWDRKENQLKKKKRKSFLPKWTGYKVRAAIASLRKEKYLTPVLLVTSELVCSFCL